MLFFHVRQATKASPSAPMPHSCQQGGMPLSRGGV